MFCGIAISHPAFGSDRDRGAWNLVTVPAADEQWSQGDSSSMDGAPWWHSFGDSILDDLMMEGMQASPDLAGAWDRVVQADALAGQLMAGLMPVVTADGVIAHAPTESLSFGVGYPTQFEQDVYSQGSLGLNASMAVDLFGRTATAWRAGRYDAEAVRGDKDAVALSLSIRIAQAYFDLVEARELVTLTQEQLTTNEAILELTSMRYQTSGDSTGLDVLQQRQQTESARTRVPQAELNEALASQRIHLLLGQRASRSPHVSTQALPDLPPQPNLGSPADLLDNRPDLKAAADRLDAARLSKTSATLALTPSIGASGGVGQQFISIEELDWQDTWSVGMTASVPLFNGGAIYNGVREAKASERAAARSVQSALLTAMQEVEGALEQERRQQAVLDATRSQLAAAQDAFVDARGRYGQGLIDYQQVLTSLTALQGAQQSELSARRDLLNVRISLHQSLGGTWTRQASTSSGATP